MIENPLAQKRIFISHSLVFLGIFCILLINSGWFFSGSQPLETDSAFRMVIGSVFIFLLPGMIWGEVLGFNSDHILELLSLSFALSLFIMIIPLPILFYYNAPIFFWIVFLYMICIIGIGILLYQKNSDSKFSFINPLFQTLSQKPIHLNWSTSLILVVLFLISFGTYRWGEDLYDISGEKWVQIAYVRYYFSLPLKLSDLCINGTPPPNLIHLWEFILAGWARLINMDPLILYYRARFVIPFLGLSGMFFLIKNIFSDKRKVEFIFWGVLIMCLGWFPLLSPSNLDWVKSADFYRGAFAFMGTIHHADAAMEILLAITFGLVLLTFKQPCLKNCTLLSGMLIASFIWHPREFFQVAIYVGIFILTLVVFPDKNKKDAIKKSLTIFTALVFSGILCFSAMKFFAPAESHSYDELKLKKVAIEYAVEPSNVFGIRNLFNFPFHFPLADTSNAESILSLEDVKLKFKEQWNFNLWLIISAVAIIPLSIIGKKADKKLSLYYILLWFFVLSWNFSMLAFIALTYSEIYVTNHRMLYIFSYIVIASAVYVLAQHYSQKSNNRAQAYRFLGVMFLSGLSISIWWQAGAPFAKLLSYFLSIFVLLSCLAILTIRKNNSFYKPQNRLFGLSILGITLFFFPILLKDYIKIIHGLMTEKRTSIEWFSNSNPLDMSIKLIHILRGLPPKQKILADPFDKSFIPCYAPHYLSILPSFIRTVIGETNDQTGVIEGRHPLFIQSNVLIGQLVALDRMNADYKGEGFNWKGNGGIVGVKNLEQTAPPIVISGSIGEFHFKNISLGKNDILQAKAVKQGVNNKFDIQFGYILGKNNFNLDIKPGQEVIFIMSAKVSGEIAHGNTEIFIQDKADQWERKITRIKSDFWQQYIISKKIRPDTTEIRLGINWQPKNEDDILEIKDIRMHIVKNELSEEFILENVDHLKILSWLDKEKIDYILIKKDYYYLQDYFKKHPDVFKISFNNTDWSELLVRYLK